MALGITVSKQNGLVELKNLRFNYNRLQVPVERMRLNIPFVDERHQAISQMIEIGEVQNVESLALHNAEPLLDLIHPRTLDRQKEAHKGLNGGSLFKQTT